MLAAYPKGALHKRLNGNVELLCQVEVDATVSACRVTKETPGQLGFGEAALSLVVHRRMHPLMIDGATVRWVVVVPVYFKVSPDFDYAMAHSLTSAERCVGFVSYVPKYVGGDEALETWRGWFSEDALRAGLKPAESDGRLSASIEAASSLRKTDEGAAEVSACVAYSRAWHSQDIGDPTLPPPPK